ncbi:hypothetical protein [Streptomyces sp. NPDC001315]|uniref:hypothetical protein n=1 Tax=Streptomyces sp. NPDC001315 TaxID=3364562 RepID=UPI00367A5B90
MTERLTTQNATITTATIQIQTLTIGKKQVTLAVFRQLPEEPLISDDGTLNGEPWGRVNYHPAKCEGHANHWHIVWQQGSELLRATVVKTPDFDPAPLTRSVPETFECEVASRYVTSLVREWIHGRVENQPIKSPTFMGEKLSDAVTMGSQLGFNVRGYASEAALAAIAGKSNVERSAHSLAEAQEELSKPLTPYTTQEWRERAVTDKQVALEKMEQEFSAARDALDKEVAEWGTHKALSSALTDAAQGEAERRQRHRDARAALAQLPQLFIAV